MQIYPREFIEHNGLPTPRTFPAIANGTIFMGESWDRFAAFILTSGPLQLSVVPNDNSTPVSFNTTSAQPLILHNLVHGLAVNLAWKVAGGGGATNLTVIESFARSDKNIPRLTNNAMSRKTKRNHKSPVTYFDMLIPRSRIITTPNFAPGRHKNGETFFPQS